MCMYEEKDKLRLNISLVSCILNKCGYKGLLSYISLETYKNVNHDEYVNFEMLNRFALVSKADFEHHVQKLVDSKCDVILVQVKEKFAILTIYIHARIEGKEIPEEAFQICRDAAKASQTICEHCGAPGYIRRDSRFWIKTLCNECDIKFLAE